MSRSPAGAGLAAYDRRVSGSRDPVEEADEPIRVFIVDDHGLVRRGVRSYLAIFDDIEVVGEAANGQEAIDAVTALAARDEPPHVVLMDLAMEPMDGVEATRRLRAGMPEIEVQQLAAMRPRQRRPAGPHEDQRNHDQRSAGIAKPPGPEHRRQLARAEVARTPPGERPDGRRDRRATRDGEQEQGDVQRPFEPVAGGRASGASAPR